MCTAYPIQVTYIATYGGEIAQYMMHKWHTVHGRSTKSTAHGTQIAGCGHTFQTEIF